MSEAIVQVSAAEVLPTQAAVLQSQGFPASGTVRPEVGRLCRRALELLAEQAAPVGALAEISKTEFATLYNHVAPDGLRSPVGDIYPQAAHLALFAGTLGQAISDTIERCFADGEYALGALLDAAASLAADRLPEILGERFCRSLAGAGRLRPGDCVLGYSPGYCGWDISGQRQVFDRLRPERIGIRLNERFLMRPLKSVSGVLIVGPARIHRFAPTYPCCADCTTRSCQQRGRTLRPPLAGSPG